MASEADSDQARLQKIVFGVFGDDTINIDKSVLPSPVADCIGYTADLPKALIYPNEKGRHKLAAAFFSFDLREAIPQKSYQRMASLASCYSVVLIGTRPCVKPLYSASTLPGKRRLTPDAKACVAVWRAIALMAVSDPL